MSSREQAGSVGGALKKVAHRGAELVVQQSRLSRALIAGRIAQAQFDKYDKDFVAKTRRERLSLVDVAMMVRPEAESDLVNYSRGLEKLQNILILGGKDKVHHGLDLHARSKELVETAKRIEPAAAHVLDRYLQALKNLQKERGPDLVFERCVEAILSLSEFEADHSDWSHEYRSYRRNWNRSHAQLKSRKKMVDPRGDGHNPTAGTSSHRDKNGSPHSHQDDDRTPLLQRQ